ncbi:MAG: DUF711 family protein [Desulfurococcaceae archaeon]
MNSLINNKPVIRSIAIFLENKSSVREFIDYYYSTTAILNDLKNTLEKNGYSVFTKRIVFPHISVDIRKKIIEEIDSSSDILVSIGYSGFSDIERELVIESTVKGFYTALYGLWIKPVEYVKQASEIIHRISSIEPFYASRLAICFHREFVESPYFPDTVSSGVESIGLSFLLPKHIIMYLRENNSIDKYPLVFRKYLDELEFIIRETTGFKNIFFDFSISPWMDNSVVDLVEEMGFKFLEPGFNYGILMLNELIGKLVELSRESRGFNEVMLPYAEDYRLIEAGGRGCLKARDLILYTSTCVAGPDMIVVPESIEKLAKYMLDTYSIWVFKKKPIALRAIPVSNKPGDSVDLGKFGKVYVIDY